MKPILMPGDYLAFLLLVGSAFSGCRPQDDIEVFVHGLPAQQIRVEQESLGVLSPEDWQAIQARDDIDGVDTGGVSCGERSCRGLLVTLFIENPTQTPWAPPLMRVRRGTTQPHGLPIAFSGYEISPNRRGRLRVLLHHPERDSPLSLHLSHSVSLDIHPPAEPPPQPPQ